MDWLDAGDATTLEVGTARVIRGGAAPIAVFRLDDGSLAAVDNRCPHEGYPLSQGSVCGRVLTCAWHNYKFDLTDGACLKGEPLPVHRVREVDGRVQVLPVEPDRDEAISRRWASWTDAMEQEREGQALRDLVRLHQLGVDPWQLAAAIARWDADRGPWGVTHGAIAAWEAACVMEPGPDCVIALAVPLQQAMRSHVRQPPRPSVEAEVPGERAGAELLARIEREDVGGAEALLRGMLDAGWGRDALEPLFWDACAAHFLDFGHPAIYTAGLFDLLDRAGWQHGPSLLVGLLHNVVNATREDLLPGWMRTRDVLDAVDPELPRWWASRHEASAPFERSLDVPVPEALQIVRDALDAGVSPTTLVDAIIRAGADRMRRFDVQHDRSDAVQDDWLSVTHCFTFPCAVRVALERWDDPRALRLLFQAARFVAHHRVLDGPETPWSPHPGDAAGLIASLERQDPSDAMGRAVWLLAHDRPALVSALRGWVLGDHAVRGIHAVHQLKTLEAALRQPHPHGVIATVRWLASPRRERATARRAREALAFVLDGRTPTLLAP